LVEYYNELPNVQFDNPKGWEAGLRIALGKFRHNVATRYTEGTLHRLLGSPDALTRRACVLALGLTGTMKTSNATLASKLHDEDRIVRRFAADGLKWLWFRADTDANNQQLDRLVKVRDHRKRRTGLDALIAQSPDFAEAYNQRAILYFQTEEWQKSIADCERVLKLNPYHYGAAAGMGRCFLKLGKHRAALRAFRNALRIHPGLEDVEETIRALESALGEEGRRDDKK
jgi:tetratricopeptide (TPR) repeat protein